MARAALIKRDNLYYVNFSIEATNSVMNSPGLHRPGCPETKPETFTKPAFPLFQS